MILTSVMWKFIKLTKSIITVMMTDSVICLTIETGNNNPSV